MNERNIFCLVLLVIFVLSPMQSRADGLNKRLVNPNPDHTWTKQVGGFFSSAKSYAVVVSISDYVGEGQGGYKKLNTRGDAQRMANFLIKDMGFDYVRLITDTEVTKKNIEGIMLDEMRALVGPNDRFVFYWSGHGEQLVRSDTNSTFGFLPLYDSKLRQFSSMISMDDIGRWNNYLQARHALFILDACLSGLAGVNIKSDPRLDQLSLPARFLLTAGTATEEAIAGDTWGGSLFTDTLIKTAREYSQLQNNVVSIYRLFDEIQQRVAVERAKIHWQKPLTPQLRDLQGGGGAFFFAGKPMVKESHDTITEAQKSVGDKSEPVEKSAMIVPPPIGPKQTTAKLTGHNHCSQIGWNDGLIIFANLMQDERTPPAISPEDALLLHLGASVPLLSKYSKEAGVASAKKTINFPGVLIGSFDVISSRVPKCDGRTIATRQTMLANGQIVAVAYSYSYKSEALTRQDGRRSMVCTPPDGPFYDVKETFDDIVNDVQIDTKLISFSDYSDFKESRSVSFGGAILGYNFEAKDISDKRSKGRKTHQCTETIIHAAIGYQTSH